MERIIVYPISANPPTWGHGDIMSRGAKKCDRLYWVAGKNPHKKVPFSEQDKEKMLKAYVEYYKLDNVTVETFEGSIAAYAKKKGASFLLRGLRSYQDFQSELELSWGNHGIAPGIETICMFCHPKYSSISSGIVRELAGLGERLDSYVHPDIIPIVQKAFRSHS